MTRKKRIVGSAKERLIAISRIWNEQNVNSMAAALAFYLFFSMPAIAVLLLTVIRWLERLIAVISVESPFFNALGSVASRLTVPEVSRLPLVLNIIGIFIIFFSVTRAFTHIERSFNQIWSIGQMSFRIQAKKKVYFFGMIILLGFCIVLALVANMVATALIPLFGLITPALTFLTILALLVLFFAFLYRLAPDVDIRWRDTLPGSLFASLSILIIYQVFSFYTGFGLDSLYSAVGSVFLLGAILVRLRTR